MDIGYLCSKKSVKLSTDFSLANPPFLPHEQLCDIATPDSFILLLIVARHCGLSPLLTALVFLRK